MPQSCDTAQRRITPLMKTIDCLKLQNKDGDHTSTPQILLWQWGSGFMPNPYIYWKGSLVDCDLQLKSMTLEFIGSDAKIQEFAQTNPVHKLVIGWAPVGGKYTCECLVRVRFVYTSPNEV